MSAKSRSNYDLPKKQQQKQPEHKCTTGSLTSSIRVIQFASHTLAAKMLLGGHTSLLSRFLLSHLGKQEFTSCNLTLDQTTPLAQIWRSYRKMTRPFCSLDRPFWSLDSSAETAEQTCRVPPLSPFTHNRSARWALNQRQARWCSDYVLA